MVTRICNGRALLRCQGLGPWQTLDCSPSIPRPKQGQLPWALSDCGKFQVLPQRKRTLLSHSGLGGSLSTQRSTRAQSPHLAWLLGQVAVHYEWRSIEESTSIAEFVIAGVSQTPYRESGRRDPGHLAPRCFSFPDLLRARLLKSSEIPRDGASAARFRPDSAIFWAPADAPRNQYRPLRAKAKNDDFLLIHSFFHFVYSFILFKFLIVGYEFLVDPVPVLNNFISLLLLCVRPGCL